MITHGGPELLVLFVVFIVTPILYRLLLKRFQLGMRIAAIAVLWIVTVLAGYWDVYWISKEARRLCKEEAGLHVYKTVEAEGFLGSINIDYWAKYGFQYVENETIMGGKKRHTMQEGKVVEEKVNVFISRYEYITDLEVLEAHFNKQKQMIKDRQTGEVLGEIVSFAVYPGWLDSRLLGILGFTWSPKGCETIDINKSYKTELTYINLVEEVIKPKSSAKGEQQ